MTSSIAIFPQFLPSTAVRDAETNRPISIESTSQESTLARFVTPSALSCFRIKGIGPT